MSSHFVFDAQLPFGIGTRVWWSRNPSGRVLVFVHGFSGKAVGTWSSFPSLLAQQPKCSGWDLIFFGYDGVHTEAVSSAGDLAELLDAIAASPADLYAKSTSSPNALRQPPDVYTRIVLVAHSLGAIVARRAMLDGYNRSTPAPWSKKTEFFAFAPAHNGAKLMSLVLETFGLAGPILSLAQLFNRYIVLRDLKEGSGTLQTLHDDLTRTYDAPSNASNLRALEVILARNDRIVTNRVLYPDPSPAPGGILAGCTHSTVCKPDEVFPQPIDLLVARL
jgi:triacylglycerol esterase/lipase EstA (alpha/beta hydrolase family)